MWLSTTEVRRGLFQKGVEMARVVMMVVMACSPSACALGMKLLGGCVEAKRVSWCVRSTWVEPDWSRSPTVRASSDLAEGPAYRAKKRGRGCCNQGRMR